MRMRTPMRAVSCACVLLASAAAWGQPTLAVLNSGPSSNTIPSGNDSTVLTFAFPREAVNLAVTDIPSGMLDGTAGANSSITVQTTGGGGFRNRSRATITNGLDTNASAALQLIGNTNADGRAAGSHLYILKSTAIGVGAGQIGNSIASLSTYLGTHTSGTDYFDIPFSAMQAVDSDSEVEESDLNGGVLILLSQIASATPAMGSSLSWRFNAAFDVFLVALDTGGGSDPNVVSEYGHIRRLGPVRPTLATSGSDPLSVSEIRIVADRQLMDDIVSNPGDTNPGFLNAADFVVAIDSTGGGAQSLDAFLTGLTGSPVIAGFTVSGNAQGFNRVLALDVSPDITNAADVAAIRGRLIGFATGANVFSVYGGRASTADFVRMTSAGDLHVEADSCPWLAARMEFGFCGNNAPAQSPFQVTTVPLVAGAQLEFSAAGVVQYQPGFPLIGPEGDSLLPVEYSCLGGSLRGMSNIHAPAGALVGVFLGPDDPKGADPPPDLEFSLAFLRDFNELSPMLRQVFFIGDGLTSVGISQRFRVPQGATRLYLGVMDALLWSDNVGSFGVGITRRGCPGDVTGDNVVDFLDLNAVLAFFGQPVGPGIVGDLNDDGVVDFLDLNIVLSFYGAPC